MFNDEFYTEVDLEVFVKLIVNTDNKEYQVIENIYPEDIDYENVEFLSPIIFNSLIKGLDVEGFKRI